MKQVFFMAVLAAGMLLTGCSKDSENNNQETKKIMEEQLIKDVLKQTENLRYVILL